MPRKKPPASSPRRKRQKKTTAQPPPAPVPPRNPPDRPAHPLIARFGYAELAQRLLANKGLIHQTAEDLGCSSAKLRRFLERHPDFAKIQVECRSMMLDYCETQLFRLIAEGDGRATMFFLKCFGRKRGWHERPAVGADRGNGAGGIVEMPALEEGLTAVGHITILQAGEDTIAPELADAADGPLRPDEDFEMTDVLYAPAPMTTNSSPTI